MTGGEAVLVVRRHVHVTLGRCWSLLPLLLAVAALVAVVVTDG